VVDCPGWLSAAQTGGAAITSRHAHNRVVVDAHVLDFLRGKEAKSLASASATGCTHLILVIQGSQSVWKEDSFDWLS
jgi:hypothetical protein